MKYDDPLKVLAKAYAEDRLEAQSYSAKYPGGAGARKRYAKVEVAWKALWVACDQGIGTTTMAQKLANEAYEELKNAD